MNELSGDIVLSDAAFDRVLDLIERPPSPSPRLRKLVGKLCPLSPEESALSSLPLCPCPADAPVGFYVRAGVRKGHTSTPIEVANPCLESACEVGGLLRCSVGHETDATDEERDDSIAAVAAYRRRARPSAPMTWEDDGPGQIAEEP